MDNKTIEEKEKEYAHLMFEIRRDESLSLEQSYGIKLISRGKYVP